MQRILDFKPYELEIKLALNLKIILEKYGLDGCGCNNCYLHK